MAAVTYCALCDRPATWIVEWNDEAQAGCEEHRDAAFSLIQDRINADAEGRPETYTYGRYAVTILPGADTRTEGIWPAYWLRDGTRVDDPVGDVRTMRDRLLGEAHDG